MPLLALERLDAGQRRNDGFIESSRGRDEDLGVNHDRAGRSIEGDVVNLLDLVPGGGLEVMLKAEAIPEAVLVDDGVPVCVEWSQSW